MYFYLVVYMNLVKAPIMSLDKLIEFFKYDMLIGNLFARGSSYRGSSSSKVTY